MKKTPDTHSSVDMLAEYDFSGGTRGKYARRYARGANVVLLEADVAKAFPTSKAVNDSLRALAAIIRKQQRPSPVRNSEHAQRAASVTKR